MDLKDQKKTRPQRNVFITGITRGLGKALFEIFISKGYTVYGVLRNESSAKEFKSKLPDNAKLILTDLSDDDCIEKIQEIIGQEPIDLLINNAGIGGESHLIGEIESEEIARLFNIHCLGAFRTVKALKNNLLRAKNPIVLNMNSRLGSITRQSNGTYEDLTVSYSYRIAKSAQNMLTNCLRKEFHDRIKFLSIHPGKMKTDIAQVDANLEPDSVANKILFHFENNLFKEENGIQEIDNEVMAW